MGLSRWTDRTRDPISLFALVLPMIGPPIPALIILYRRSKLQGKIRIFFRIVLSLEMTSLCAQPIPCAKSVDSRWIKSARRFCPYGAALSPESVQAVGGAVSSSFLFFFEDHHADNPATMSAAAK